MKKLIVLLFCSFCGFAFGSDLPDPTSTPGFTNPAVMQSNIQDTICVSGYTKTIRPTASYTTKLKLKQLKSGVYKSDLGAAEYEEDHLVSLELGGDPMSELNLWPQHWSAPYGAHEKDHLENTLKRLVCSYKITLVDAQKAIASNWIAAYKKYVRGK